MEAASMNGGEKLQIGVSQDQFERLLSALGQKDGKKGPNPWIQIIAVPVGVAVVGAAVTWFYNRQQAEINRVQTMEKFVAYFSKEHSIEQQIAAMATMVELGYQDVAADFLVLTSTAKTEYEKRLFLPFLVAKGDKLLPRLCLLVVSGRATGVSQTAMEYAGMAVGQSIPSFQKLKDIALNTEDCQVIWRAASEDEATRMGALEILLDHLGTVAEAPGGQNASREEASEAADFRIRYGDLDSRLEAFISSKEMASARGFAILCLTRSGTNVSPYHDFLAHLVRNSATDLDVREEALVALSVSNSDLSEFNDILHDPLEPTELRSRIAWSEKNEQLPFFASLIRETNNAGDQIVAIEGLRHIKCQDSVPLLRQAYATADSRVKDDILNALAFYDCSDAMDFIKNACSTEQNPALRARAFRALIYIQHAQGLGSAQTDEILMKGLQDQSSLVLEAIFMGLHEGVSAQFRRAALKRLKSLDDPFLKSELTRVPGLNSKFGEAPPSRAKH